MFADDTKVSAKIKTQEDTECLQQDLNKIYTWADENLMEFNENIFLKKSHGDTKNISKGIYKAKSGQIIEENKSREAEPMMMMFNSYIRSKLDYCCLI